MRPKDAKIKLGAFEGVLTTADALKKCALFFILAPLLTRMF